MPDPKNAKSIFLAAIEIESEADRRGFVNKHCEGNEALAAEVNELLDNQPRDSYLESPVRPELLATQDLMQQSAMRSPHVGAEIGPYKLREMIGEGGMGCVFVAEQERPIRRKVALKVIKPGMDSKAVVARFEAERQALALMEHPNIAKVLDAGTASSGRPYFAMELVKGVPITEYCDLNKLTVKERLELFIQVCQAIQHAHQKGIIHRDIKPSNVLVTLHDGKAVPKVIDFGVAKALTTKLTEKTLYTAHFQVVGTLLYMSPEQAELSGLDIDTRSDVYALGVLLYELLTGTTPFQQSELSQAGFDEQRRIIREKQPPRASVRISSLGETATAIAGARRTDVKDLSQQVQGDLDWILLKALEKDRTRRYESASQFATDCRSFLAQDIVLARAPTLGYRLSRNLRRNRIPIAVAAVVFACLAIALITTLSQLSEQRRFSTKLEEKNKELEQLTEKLQSQLFENAAMQIMRLNRKDALVVINELKLEAELGQAEDELLRGIWEFYSGSIPDARAHLERALSTSNRPNWVIPNAILSVANTFEQRDDEGDHYRKLLRLVEVRGQENLSELERLFVGHARIYPETEKAREMLKQLNKLALPLADAIIADSYVHEASESGEVKPLLSSMTYSQNAADRLQDNAYSLMVRLWAINHALLTHSEELPSKQQLVEEGHQLVKQLSNSPSRLNILANMVLFYLVIERPEKALQAAQRESLRFEGEAGVAWQVLPRLCLDGNRDAALRLLDEASNSEWDQFFTGLVFRGEDSKVVEAIDSARWGTGSRKFVAIELLSLLLKDVSIRSEQVEKLRIRLGDRATDWDRVLMRFIDQKSSEKELLAAASADKGKSQFRLSRAYLAIAMQALGSSDYAAAEKRLLECQAVKRPFECFFATAILQMLRAEGHLPAQARP